MTNPILNSLRSSIRKNTHADESKCLQHLLEQNQLTEAGRRAAEELGLSLVVKCRENPEDHGLLDAFLMEYSLSTQEGVALMCLAEALLRVPDSATKDRLISEKILSGDWGSHRGKSEKLFVNAATWGMILTGEIVRVENKITRDPSGWLRNLVNRLGEPAVRFGVMQAMKLMGQQYVLGANINNAIKRGHKDNPKGTRFSFDMLGEGARTDFHAKKYFDAYMSAIKAIGASNRADDVYVADGISVKLTALYPRYEYSQRESVLETLLPRVTELAMEAKRWNIGFTIDAEEAARLDIELDIFERLAMDSALAGWNGLGFVLQAYQKRALAVADWLIELAKASERRLMVRLVKGAYWDAEIKHAQEQGFEDYPVFTRKTSTDLSYQVCAARLLANTEVVYPQFATHNAYTVAMILQQAKAAGAENAFEFQRLHGMGDLLYGYLPKEIGTHIPLRVYAPVGVHADLLPYLVRRLLENGANCSFVNQFLDKSIPASAIVGNVEDEIKALPGMRHSQIPLPADIFRFAGEARDNAKGFDLDDPDTVSLFARTVEAIKNQRFHAQPIINGISSAEGEECELRSPADSIRLVGHYQETSEAQVEEAMAAAHQAQPQWQDIGHADRASMLERCAELMERQCVELCALISLEAGRTLPDAVAEVREAVDFCRYYAIQAHTLSEQAQQDPRLEEGRGVFVCISPWNFPLAIFVGQIAAALVTGNTVIAKPAEQSPLIAAEAIRILHQAGVPGEVLHFLPGTGAKLGPMLMADSRVAGVAFTGSTETAKRIHTNLLKRGSTVPPLIAETGGQNAMIVDSTALHEQVVDDVIQSAFLSAGQRCSALRVLFVQEDVADSIIHMLKNAITFLRIGQPWLLESDIGPVIDQRAHSMLQAHVDAMHSQAKFIGSAPLPDNLPEGHYFAPHIFELTSLSQLEREVFGPILHVIRYKTSQLDSVLEQINDSGYGLTLGVHSRLTSFANEVIAKTRVGNTYINRNMVGAVVGVNPFGGQGLSGTGFKAGGPHYLLRFTHLWPSNNAAQVSQNLLVNSHKQTRENDDINTDFSAIKATQRAWNQLTVEQRCQCLEDIVAGFDQALLSAEVYGKALNSYMYDLFNSAKTSFQRQTLPGPTGESNVLSLHGRGTFLVPVSDKDFAHNLVLAMAALAAGNAVLFIPAGQSAVAPTHILVEALNKHLPIHLINADFKPRNVESYIAHPDILGVAAHQQSHLIMPIIKRPGAIIPFVESLSQAHSVLPFCSEKTTTNNIVATGGNALLLNLSEQTKAPTARKTG